MRLLILLALFAAPSMGHQDPASSPPPRALAYRLDKRLAIGLVCEDRSLRGSALQEVVERLNEESSAYVDLATLLTRPSEVQALSSPGFGFNLVAFESWSRKDRDDAASLGVFSVLKIESIQARKGKPVTTSRAGGGFRYQGLRYKLKLTIDCIAAPKAGQRGGSVRWEEISSWREEGDYLKSPGHLDPTGLDLDERVRRLTLSDVAVHHLSPTLAQMAAVDEAASLWLDDRDLDAAYAELSDAERAEFWMRAGSAWHRGAALPIRGLQEIGFREWERMERAKSEAAPGLTVAIATVLLGSAHPNLRLGAWKRPEPEGATSIAREADSKDIEKAVDLVRLTQARDRAFRSADLLPYRFGSAGRPPFVIVSDDCDLDHALKDAPDPMACYALVRVCDDGGFKATSSAKPKRFSNYAGAQLVRLVDDRWFVDAKVAADDLTPEELYRLVARAAAPSWPHEHD